MPTLISLSWYLHRSHTLLMFWWYLEFRRISPKDIKHLLWLFPINPILECTHKSSHVSIKMVYKRALQIADANEIIDIFKAWCGQSKGRQLTRHPLLCSSEALPVGKWAWLGGATMPSLTPSVITMSATLLPCSFYSKKKMSFRKRLSASASEKPKRTKFWLSALQFKHKELVSQYSLFTLNQPM